MGRKRNPKRDDAARLWLESKKKLPLKEVAEKIGVSDGLVRKWKCEDKWDDMKLRKIAGEYVVCVPKKSGGQSGNKNAVGAGAPAGNKNAVTTGEFEEIFFNTLTTEEQSLIRTVPSTKKDLLCAEIKLLTTREHRMLARIEKFKDKLMQTSTISTEFESALFTQKSKSLPGFTALASLEDALTRIQSLKLRQVELLEKIERGEMEAW